MPPSWFSRSSFRRRFSRRRRRQEAGLRVRQLERRRVLDAAIQSLVIAPVVAHEGQTVTATATATGSGPITFDWSVTEDGNEIASGSNPAINPNDPATFDFELPDDSEQMEHLYQLHLSVIDSDNTSDVATLDLDVNNVRPVLVVASDQTLNEGALLDLSGVGAPPLALFIDDGIGDTHTATVDWGDGSPLENATLFSGPGVGALGGTHTYADNGSYKVTVTVMDDDGGSDTQAFQVTVKNVPPVLVVAADQTTNEGALVDLSGVGAPPLGLFVDDGIGDTHTATIDWGDGSPVQNATVFAHVGSGALGGTHTYADNGVYTVTVTVTDDDGASDAESFTVEVKNVAPTATLSNNGPVDEGSAAQVKISSPFDPGLPDAAAGFRYAYDLDNDGTFDVGDGTYAGSTTNDSQTVPATLLDDGPAAHAVRARILDKDGGFTDYVTNVAVQNVAPTLANVSGDTIDEGDVATVLATIVDPSAGDVFQVDVDWRDGAIASIAGLGSSNASGSVGTTDFQWIAATRELRLSHRYVDDGPSPGNGTASDIYNVTLVVHDDNAGGSGPYLAPVIVGNVRPVLVVASDQTVNEGALLDLSGVGAPPLALFIDDGIGDTHTATVDWGDGSPLENATLFAGPGVGALGGTHTYADNGIYTVTVTVMDDDGFSDTQAFQVTVKNVPPVLVVATDQTVNEGSLLDLSGVGAPPLGLFVDDGIGDTHTATIDWGDGSPLENATLFAGPGVGALGGTHTYADNGIYTVTVTVMDDDGGSDIESFTVTVNNVAPSLTVVGPQSIDEGGLLTITNLGTISDPGFDNPNNIPSATVETFTFSILWGDGTTADNGSATIDDIGGVLDFTDASFDGSHTYADDGIYTVTVTVFDDDGGSHLQQFTVTVSNVAPTLVLPHGNQSILEGQTVSFADLGTFTDPGFDNPLNPTTPATGDPLAESFTFDIDWGDGRDAVLGMNVADTNGAPGMRSSGTIAGSHTYADDGIYTVTITVHDDNGGSHAQQFTVTVGNVTPTLINTAGLAVNEGSAFTLVGLNVVMTDPGFDNLLNPLVGGELQETFAIHSINWGDGSATDTASVSIANRVSGQPGVPTTAQFSHAAYTYADDGDYTVTVRVADDDMGAFADPTRFVSGTAGVDFVDLVFTIHVNNVAPTLTSITPSTTTINESESVSFTALFSDPGFDNPLNPSAAVPPAITDPLHESFTYDIDWGDGRQAVAAVPVADANGSAGVPSTGTFGGTHVYADDGLYTVTITIHDDNGGLHVQTFQVTVENINPAFVPLPGGESFEGDDVTSEGFTKIRGSFADPGFDNTTNPNPADPPSITDTLRESFTHVVQWGDGTVDAVHTYVVGGTYTVVVTVTGPSGTQSYSFAGVDSALHPMVTLVSGQEINDPAVVAQPFTFIVDWGDGAEQTIPLMLRAPEVPMLTNGLTTVVMSARTSGSEAILTDGAFEIEHRYLGPPDPSHPTADIRIDVMVVDDNNGSVSDFVMVPNPGIQPINVAIDTTPAIPRLELPPVIVQQVFIDRATNFTQGLQQTDARVASSELAATSERYLELEVIAPDGTVVSRHRIRDEALADLRAFFATLPDNHYRIYLVRTENNSRRLIMDVYVRRGRVIDPTDDSEGTRDRPPTSDEPVQTAPPPLEENPFLDQVPDVDSDNAALTPAASDGASGGRGRGSAEPPVVTAADNTASSPAQLRDIEAGPILAPLRASSRWIVPLVGVGLAAGRRSWSQEVHAALEQAEESDWQRLRRAGRTGYRRKP